MATRAILLPVFLQVGLTFFLGFWLGTSRIGALKRGEVRTADIALGQPAWPPRPTRIARSFQSQLEVPVLFYVLVLVALATATADLLLAALSWIFVATRLAHAVIHTGSNDVRKRFAAFLAGVLVLLAMWVIVAVQLVTGSGP